eukprot:766826_1
MATATVDQNDNAQHNTMKIIRGERRGVEDELRWRYNRQEAVQDSAKNTRMIQRIMYQNKHEYDGNAQRDTLTQFVRRNGISLALQGWTFEGVLQLIQCKWIDYWSTYNAIKFNSTQYNGSLVQYAVKTEQELEISGPYYIGSDGNSV